jgi:RimJ/RimL family protein N-acetyltransferase
VESQEFLRTENRSNREVRFDRSFESIPCERVVIRRFGTQDVEALSSYRSDPDVARYQGWSVPFSLDRARDLVTEMSRLAPGIPGTWFQFAVALASTHELIGDVALRITRHDSRQAELGFTIATDHQGRGYATEAVRALLEYAFARLELHRVFAFTDRRNVPAQRLFSRLGFRREGELVESAWSQGAWVDEFLYAKLEPGSDGIRGRRGGESTGERP